MTQGTEFQSSPNTPLIITHFLHPEHPLTFENGGPYCCNGCQKPSPTGGSRYSCRACNFDLDWACAMSNSSSLSSVPSATMQHYLHPQHTLMLQGGCGYRCNACGKTSPGGTRYHCLACDFDLDWACAYSSHSHHNLQSSPAPIPLLQFNYGQVPGPTQFVPGYYNMPGYAGGHSFPQYQNPSSSSSSTTTGSGSGSGKAMVKSFLTDLAKGAIVTLLLGDEFQSNDSSLDDESSTCLLLTKTSIWVQPQLSCLVCVML